MALAGIGVDMLEIARMQHALDTNPHFIERVFTPEERAYCDRCARPAEHYAARFAARGAVLKALGCMPGEGVTRRDVSVGHGDNGRPVAILAGRAKQVANERGVSEIALSLSFTHDVATAMALLVTDEVRPKPKEERDPERELLSSFKQARSVIDELERMQGDVSAVLESVPSTRQQPQEAPQDGAAKE